MTSRELLIVKLALVTYAAATLNKNDFSRLVNSLDKSADTNSTCKQGYNVGQDCNSCINSVSAEDKASTDTKNNSSDINRVPKKTVSSFFFGVFDRINVFLSQFDKRLGVIGKPFVLIWLFGFVAFLGLFFVHDVGLYAKVVAGIISGFWFGIYLSRFG
ncbi:hypothetical protein CYQ88_10875 [Hydrogenovibrio sp. SC-1]|uniref:hypothetical protein n=1 Tax=Hydrogenovibrio sp. SC-1 TaxID=2065820 RepID=UPI000C7A3DDE|nr:hypothetical protein [Hydrogenovibrio sp. SC-1]PLA73518.1 hypothetical protein CYQ88_10875 [Hydrogenovibrio sp. SC-1]